MLSNTGAISKFIVAVIGAVSTGLTQYYGSAKWLPIVLASLGAVAVYLIPNTPKPKANPTQPTQPTVGGTTP